ncbi:DNA polymerase Y family protein [Teredinibacter sp. KSP-S5-2]|uniref:Y-family DNA polymerase n=1 Tax=Teredinibacter sp. KSP-S5-2 TaxID=3034506 RepID=UPI002934749E|nr:DNA polymerase Y family protein [Teredinibacter sp. KSP-S5-2]WNO09789.1 DNA polymerase Y family protein [Teredinibacter sp. KSP-S5-2]
MDKVRTIRNKIWLALRFQALPLEALAVHETDIATVVENKRVIYASNSAQDCGVRLNIRQGTAQALTGALSYERDAQAEKRLIDNLMEKLYQFTPYIEHYQIHNTIDVGIILELSGSVSLFGGLLPIIKQIKTLLLDMALSTCFGLAHTKLGAWLLTYDPDSTRITQENQDIQSFIQQLAQLPTSVLREYPDTVNALQKIGFKYLNDILQQVEQQGLACLRDRFGHHFSQYIAEIFGIDSQIKQTALFETPVQIYHPEEYFIEDIQFDYPVSNHNQLEQPMLFLLERLSDYLQKRQHQCQEITWCLSDIYHNQQQITVRFDQNHSQLNVLYELSRIKLESVALNFEVDTLELICQKTQPQKGDSQLLEFKQGNVSLTHQFEITLAKLKARIGEENIRQVQHIDSHVPEQSSILVEYSQVKKNLPIHPQITGDKPDWLFGSPYKISHRHQTLYWQGEIELLQGPERIQGQWWDTPIARDYFIAKRSDNVRLWIFKDLHSQNWFVHGFFS